MVQLASPCWAGTAAEERDEFENENRAEFNREKSLSLSMSLRLFFQEYHVYEGNVETRWVEV